MQHRIYGSFSSRPNPEKREGTVDNRPGRGPIRAPKLPKQQILPRESEVGFERVPANAVLRVNRTLFTADSIHYPARQFDGFSVKKLEANRIRPIRVMDYSLFVR